MSSYTSTVFPDAIGEVIDLLTAAMSKSVPPNGRKKLLSSLAATLPNTGVRLLGYLVLGAVANVVHTACLENLIQRVGRRLRRTLFANIMKQDLTFFYENTSGRYNTHLAREREKINK